MDHIERLAKVLEQHGIAVEVHMVQVSNVLVYDQADSTELFAVEKTPMKELKTKSLSIMSRYLYKTNNN